MTNLGTLARALRLSAESPWMRLAIEAVVRELLIADATRGSIDSFAALRGARGLELHLGCGSDRRPGWINIDIAPAAAASSKDDAVFIAHDLRRGLPLSDGSAAFIYSSHFFEHLDASVGLQLMGDCFRVLEPGGIFRIALPDLKSIFKAYLQGDAAFFDVLRDSGMVAGLDDEAHTLLDFVNFGVHQYGEHKVVYDEEKVVRLLRKIGFRSAGESAYRPEVDVGLEIRRRHTFYVEAIK